MNISLKRTEIFCLFVCLFATISYAEIYSGNCGYNGCDSLQWKINTETGTLDIFCKYSGSVARMGNYNPNNLSPWKLQPYPSYYSTVTLSGVSNIGNYAFYYCSGLTSVTIPNSVTSIGQNAFSGCSNLTSITIPNSVTSTGNYAFSSCSALTSISIPNSVTSIGDGVFSGCSGLTSIEVASGNSKYDSRNNCNAIIETATNTLIIGCLATIIPNSVTSIGNNAFAYCSGLTSITIPNSVTTIGDGVFLNCSSLTSVTIPNSVTSISSSVFSGCSNLASVNIGSNAIISASRTPNTSMKSIFGNQVKEYVIGNSVTCIGSNAFYGCTSLTSVTIGNGVTSIGGSAFYGCTSLTSVTIGDGVTSIGSCAFYICSSLTSVTIPNSVTSIGDKAFCDCYGLISMTIGSGVLSIGEKAFTNTSLKKVIWLTNTPPNGYSNVNGITNYVANNQYSGLSNVNVYPFLSSLFEVNGVRYVPVSPSERTCDAIDCVHNKSVENLIIGETVTNRGITLTIKQINPYLCYGNTFIKDANLSFIGNIGAYAFCGCTGLNKSIITNQGSIGDFAFSGCKSLQIVGLGQGITSVGDNAFYGCSILEGIVIPYSVTSIGKNSFANCSAMTSAQIGNGVKSILAYAFSGCSSLQNVQIGTGVTTIDQYTFNGCKSLPIIQIPQNVTTINDNVFNGCTSLKTVLMDDGERELSLGSNGSSPLFVSCPLDSVYIGRKIIYPKTSDKGYSPFYNNRSLRSVTIADKETEITPKEFNSCSALQAIELGEGILSIGSDAFKDCSMLQSIVIPDSVTSIGNNAFENCSAITSAKIGNGVKSIHAYAFSGCSSLPSIQIPQNVNTIGDYVFNGCKSLKTVLMDEGERELSLGSNGSSPLFVSCPLDSVYIGRNITYPTASSKGYSPFYRNTSLRSVAITDRETEISMNEFYGCANLKNVRIGDGVTTFGDWAFSGCSSLDYFSFGSSVETIGKEVFSDCTAMTRLISRAIVPPTCGSQALDDINKWECNLYVPDGTIAAYQAANQWKEFFFIIDPDAIAEVKADEGQTEGISYDTQGRMIGKPQKGVNIIRYSDGTSRKVLVK